MLSEHRKRSMAQSNVM